MFMQVIGMILLTAGALIGLAGDLMILRSAYHQGVAVLFTCLMLPFGCWLFALLDMRRPGRALILSLGGAVFAVAGLRLCGIPIRELCW